jgi:hypothetical protein
MKKQRRMTLEVLEGRALCDGSYYEPMSEYAYTGVPPLSAEWGNASPSAEGSWDPYFPNGEDAFSQYSVPPEITNTTDPDPSGYYGSSYTGSVNYPNYPSPISASDPFK